MVCRDSLAYLKLSSGNTVKAKLVIAADGRNSILREKAGISTKTHRFGQKALAFAVTHSIPHKNISTESLKYLFGPGWSGLDPRGFSFIISPVS